MILTSGSAAQFFWPIEVSWRSTIDDGALNCGWRSGAALGKSGVVFRELRRRGGANRPLDTTNLAKGTPRPADDAVPYLIDPAAPAG
jgi:hypothetical protein